MLGITLNSNAHDGLVDLAFDKISPSLARWFNRIVAWMVSVR